MKLFDQRKNKIRSLVETLHKDMQLSVAVWPVLRDAPAEQQGKLLQLYERLFHASHLMPTKPNPTYPGQSLFAPLLVNSFLELRFLLNCPEDTFYRDACQWLMKQESFGMQIQLLHYMVTDPRLPYFQVDPKLRQGMSDQHFELLEEDIPEGLCTEIRRLIYRSVPCRSWRYRQLLAILDREEEGEQRAAILAHILETAGQQKQFEERLKRLATLEQLEEQFKTPDER